MQLVSKKLPESWQFPFVVIVIVGHSSLFGQSWSQFCTIPPIGNCLDISLTLYNGLKISQRMLAGAPPGQGGYNAVSRTL